MTVYAQGLLRTFQLEGVSFALDNESRRRLRIISAIPFLAVAAMVAASWLTVVIGQPVYYPGESEALMRGQMAASYAMSVLTPLSLAVLLGAGFLDLTDPERKWALAMAAGAALVALGFAATVVVMSLGLGLLLALDYFVNTWAGLGADLGLIAAGYAYCARPRRHSTS
jgi:hypothetical protein